MAQLLVLYNTPRDPSVFDRYYQETHIPLARKIPGLHSLTISHGPVQALAGNAPYLVAILDFDSMGDLVAALASPEGHATANDLRNFASGGATLLLYDNKAVWMTEDQSLDFARRYTSAWCSQAASVAAFYSPNGSLLVNDDALAQWRTAITELAQSFMTALPDMRVVMDDLRVHGDRVEYHWTLTGTITQDPVAPDAASASAASSFGWWEPMDWSRPPRDISAPPSTAVN